MPRVIRYACVRLCCVCVCRMRVHLHAVGKPQYFSWKNIVPWRIGDLWKSKRNARGNIVIYRIRDIGLAMWRPEPGEPTIYFDSYRREDRIGHGGKSGRIYECVHNVIIVIIRVYDIMTWRVRTAVQADVRTRTLHYGVQCPPPPVAIHNSRWSARCALCVFFLLRIRDRVDAKAPTIFITIINQKPLILWYDWILTHDSSEVTHRVIVTAD